MFKFKNNKEVSELVKVLIENPLTSIPPINIACQGNRVYSFDNRRLLAYQLASSENPDIRIPYKKSPLQ